MQVYVCRCMYSTLHAGWDASSVHIMQVCVHIMQVCVHIMQRVSMFTHCEGVLHIIGAACFIVRIVLQRFMLQQEK